MLRRIRDDADDADAGMKEIKKHLHKMPPTVSSIVSGQVQSFGKCLRDIVERDKIRDNSFYLSSRLGFLSDSFTQQHTDDANEDEQHIEMDDIVLIDQNYWRLYPANEAQSHSSKRLHFITGCSQIEKNVAVKISAVTN